MTQTILVVDDNENAQKLLIEALSIQEFSVVVAGNGQEALAQMASAEFDLILLDVMMPLMDGYQFISRVRRTSRVPIIMLTAKRQEHEVVRGFELGADDYVTKPFRMRELLMRVRAVLRRSDKASVDKTQHVGNLTLDHSNSGLMLRDKQVDLTRAEFCVLACLAGSAETAVTRAALSTHLIQHRFSGSENTLKIHIRNLRRKIEPDPRHPIYIETVFGIGYRLRSHE